MFTFDADCPVHLALGAGLMQVYISAQIDILFMWHQMLNMSEMLVLAFMLICYICNIKCF